jgi:hypothetical protein
MAGAQLRHEVTERHPQGVSDSVPSIDGAVGRAMFEVNQYGSRQPAPLGERVVGQEAFGTQSAQFKA